MELSNNDIAQIERYLDGTLSTEEVQAFELRMQQDAEFATEVDIFLDVIEGLKAGGRNEVKANVAAAGAAVIAAGNLQPYTPSINGETSTEDAPSRPKSSFGRRLVSIIFLGAAVAGFYMWYTDQIPEEWLKFFKSDRKVKSDTIKNETQREIEYTVPSDTIIRYDTTVIEAHGDVQLEILDEFPISEGNADDILNSSTNNTHFSDTNADPNPPNDPNFSQLPRPESLPELELALAS